EDDCVELAGRMATGHYFDNSARWWMDPGGDPLLPGTRYACERECCPRRRLALRSHRGGEVPREETLGRQRRRRGGEAPRDALDRQRPPDPSRRAASARDLRGLRRDVCRGMCPRARWVVAMRRRRDHSGSPAGAEVTWADAFKILAAAVVAVGGAGTVMAGLSSRFGKLWADRLMENYRAR